VGRYKALDTLSKLIVISLSITTVIAAGIAASKGMQMQADFIEPSPWTLSALPFIIALMGWMPAPIEISAINSLWLNAKQRHNPANYRDGMFDFNVGFITSAVLALFFLALGAYVQYGSGEAVQMKGSAYVPQLINMYAVTIGDWSRPLVAFIAFACMYGTTITVIDGYPRAIAEAARLVRGKPFFRTRELFAWITWVSVSAVALILWFQGALGELLRFAMITAFLAAPVFAWLNYGLVQRDEKHRLSTSMNVLAIIGLVYLIGFAALFVLNETGLLK
jgi:membrane protein